MTAAMMPITDRKPALLPAPLRKLRRFLRSPKGYLLVALTLLGLVAAPSVHVHDALVTVAAAVAGATLMEVVLVRFGQDEWRFPISAVLTGLIVGLIMSPQEPWLISAAAGVIATDAKHLLRFGRSHIFNPAAVGLLAVFVLFATGQSWWGALTDLPGPAVLLLIVAGYLVADRANKLPAAIAFLATYVALFTMAAFVVDANYVRDVFRTPFVQMALFFGLFMVTDPPTSPVPFYDQVLFGIMVAAAGYMTYMATRGLYFLLVGILIGNAVYAAWREIQRRFDGRDTVRAAG